MVFKHPMWFQKILNVVDGKMFTLFYNALLVVGGAYMSFSETKHIGFAMGFFVVWILGLLVLQESNAKIWKKIVGGILGAAFCFIFIFQSFKNAHKSENDQLPTAIPTTVETPKKESPNLIKNGDFERDFFYWRSFGKLMPISIDSMPEVMRVASADSAMVSRINTPNNDIISIDGQFGRNNTRCLLIENGQKNTLESYGGIQQRIEGLKPKTKYQLRFYMKGSISSHQSLWFIIGDSWGLRGRFYKMPDDPKEYPDWKEFKEILTTGDWSEADFSIVSDDKTHLLRIDDITLTEVSK